MGNKPSSLSNGNNDGTFKINEAIFESAIVQTNCHVVNYNSCGKGSHTSMKDSQETESPEENDQEGSVELLDEEPTTSQQSFQNPSVGIQNQQTQSQQQCEDCTRSLLCSQQSTSHQIPQRMTKPRESHSRFHSFENVNDGELEDYHYRSEQKEERVKRKSKSSLKSKASTQGKGIEFDRLAEAMVRFNSSENQTMNSKCGRKTKRRRKDGTVEMITEYFEFSVGGKENDCYTKGVKNPICQKTEDMGKIGKK